MPDSKPEPLPPTMNEPPATRALASSDFVPPTNPTTLPDSQAAPPPPSWWPTVPGYEILSELGRGGMGVVYKARQTRADRVVALKMIRGSIGAGLQEKMRFRIEAEAVARLQHANIVQLHEVGELQVGGEDLPYFSIEFVAGGSLDKKLNGTAQPPRAAAALAEKLARAMHYAHSRGVVHRDLKPANVLLATDGEPKVADFGLAKRLDEGSDLSRTGTILGTPHYMAPEQAEGRMKDVGPPSDVWSLGAILYELLTGRPPFKAENVRAVLDQVIKQEPIPPRKLEPHVPVDLETICLKCLHKEQVRRYTSAADLAEDLRRFLAGEPIQARPVGWVERLAKWVKRRPVVAALAAIHVIAGTTVIGVGIWYNTQLAAEQKKTAQQRDQAQEQRDRAEKAEQEALRDKKIAESAEEKARQRATLGFLAYGRACGLASRLATYPRKLTEPARAEFRAYYYMLVLISDKEIVQALTEFDAKLRTSTEDIPPPELKQLSLRLARACREGVWHPIKKDYPELAEQVRVLIYERTCGVVEDLVLADSASEAACLRRQFWELYWGEMGLIETSEVERVMVVIGEILYTHGLNPLADMPRQKIARLAVRLREKCGLKPKTEDR